MWVIKHRTLCIGISTVLVAASIVLIAVQGLRFGIEFKGGSLTEIEYEVERPEISSITALVNTLPFGGVVVQPTEDNGAFIKTRDLTEDEHVLLLETLRTQDESLTEVLFTSIGPSVGDELKKKSTLAFLLVSLGIVFFIAYTFRKVSKPVSSWKYGFIAIITLLHDVILATGVFTVLGALWGAEVDTLFVVALLTILGLSVNDTIVVFDRIRENLGMKSSDRFEDIVGKSIDQTYTRSINTSLSTIIVLLALCFFGPESTRIFSITLAAGMFFGTYSSIFLASPLLVATERLQKSQ